MKPLFCYFGGKRRIANEVWKRLGKPDLYIEPFLGGGAVFFAKPEEYKGGFDLLNDSDGLIINFYRAVRVLGDELFSMTQIPTSECDLMANLNEFRKEKKDLIENLCKDNVYYDLDLAIMFFYNIYKSVALCGISESSTRKSVKPTVKRYKFKDRGVLFEKCKEIFKNAILDSSDWKNIIRKAIEVDKKIDLRRCFFLDPPYRTSNIDKSLYNKFDPVFPDIINFCLENELKYPIAICGIDGDYPELDKTWEKLLWESNMGLKSFRKKDESVIIRKKAVVYFSPACHH